ncbi:hypothetical protein JHK86_025248 [Glycine max]|nr:hypothetical protein JHK86_025248 [Glycine max]
MDHGILIRKHLPTIHYYQHIHTDKIENSSHVPVPILHLIHFVLITTHRFTCLV